MVFGILVASLGFAVLLKTQPFVSDSDDVVATLAQCVLVGHLFAALLIRTQDLLPEGGSIAGKDQRFDRDAVGLLVLLLVWGVPGVAAVMAAVDSFSDAWARLLEDHEGTPGASVLKNARVWKRPALLCFPPPVPAVAGQGGGTSGTSLALNPMASGAGAAIGQGQPLAATQLSLAAQASSGPTTSGAQMTPPLSVARYVEG
jgi:hypothetical protein